MFIKVRAFPSSKEEEIVERSDNSYEIKIREKPIKGMANKALIRALSSYFGVSESNVRLVKGFRERNKIFEIKS